MSAKQRAGGRPQRGARFVVVALGVLVSACCQPGSDGTRLWDGPFVAVSTDRSSTCAIRGAGDAVCWGEAGVARVKPPPGPFRGVASNDSCAVGLRPTGQLEGWGESCAPPPTGDFLMVSAQHEACALRKDGNLVCWAFAGGIYQPPSGSARPFPPRAPEVKPGSFTRVAQGGAYTCAIRASGAIECWGNCTFRGSKTTDCPARVPAPRGVWTELASGDDFSCALSDLGEITCWGDPDVPLHPPSGKGFSAISARGDVACALDAHHEILCWGRPIRWNATTYTPPAGPFSGLAVGGAHVCGLRLDGKLSCWGVDQQGQVSGRAPWPRT